MKCVYNDHQEAQLLPTNKTNFMKMSLSYSTTPNPSCVVAGIPEVVAGIPRFQGHNLLAGLA